MRHSTRLLSAYAIGTITIFIIEVENRREKISHTVAKMGELEFPPKSAQFHCPLALPWCRWTVHNHSCSHSPSLPEPLSGPHACLLFLKFFQEAISNLKLQPSQYPKREKIQDKTRWTDQSEVERLYNPHLWNPRGSHTKSKVVSGFLPTTFSVPHHPPPPALSSLPSLLIFFLDQLNFPGPHSTCLVHSGKILSTHC